VTAGHTQPETAGPGVAGRGRSRKARGSRTQDLVAGWYQQLWPFATPQGSGRPGRDVLNVPLSIEVKARAGFNPTAWIREARKRARPEEDELPPHAVLRPNEIGEMSVGDWIVLRRLEDDTAILAELIMLRKQLKGEEP